MADKSLPQALVVCTNGKKSDGVNQDKLTDSIAYCCLQAYLALKSDTHQLFEQQGLRPVEYAVLQIVRSNPQISQKLLAQTIRVSPPNMATLLDRMETANMLKRQRNPRDKRSHILVLTALGLQLIASTEARVSGAESHVNLNEVEHAQLLHLLKKVFLP